MTTIEWTDAVWNPFRGCSLASPGCTNCYAMRQAHRFSGKGGAYEGLTQLRNKGPVWTGAVRYVPEMLTVPLRWRKQKRVFVNSMSDCFHEKVSASELDSIFAVMAICHMHERIPSHTFQILTKRAERMRDYMHAMPIEAARIVLSKAGGALMEDGDMWADEIAHHMPWPLPNVWLGVSVENQKYADERLPFLIKTPAAVRFVSYEPALGPVDLSIWMYRGVVEAKPGDADYDAIDWVIVGGESGPGARPFCQEWAETTIRQCKAAGVPCFFKQYGAQPVDGEGVAITLEDCKGGVPSEWPKALRVRQWPEART